MKKSTAQILEFVGHDMPPYIINNNQKVLVIFDDRI